MRLYERSATLSALQLSAQGRPGDLPLLTLNDTLTTYGQGGNGEVLAVVDGRVPSAWIPSPPPPPPTSAPTAANTTESASSFAIAVKPVARVCGNGKRSSDEGCDDGNSRAGDGCDAACVPRFRLLSFSVAIFKDLICSAHQRSNLQFRSLNVATRLGAQLKLATYARATTSVRRARALSPRSR